MSIQGIRDSIERASQEFGFSHFGLSPLQLPLSFEFYENWLQEGLHGDMKYLAEHALIKKTPQLRWPRAQSALIFAIPYFPHPEPSATQKLSSARVSLYAQGMDYHF